MALRMKKIQLFTSTKKYHPSFNNIIFFIIYLRKNPTEQKSREITRKLKSKVVDGLFFKSDKRLGKRIMDAWNEYPPQQMTSNK